MAFVFSIPLSQSLSTKLLASVFLFSLLVHSEGGFTRRLAQAWDIALYLLVLTIGLLYSENVDDGLKEIETSLSFFVLPFVLAKIPNFDSQYLRKSFYAFIMGLLVACLIYLGHASWLYLQGDDSRAFFSGHLTQVIANSHPTYLAYYLIFAIGFGLSDMYYSASRVPPIVIILFVFFFFIILMLTAGQTAFISMLLIFSFFILKFLSEEDRKKIKILTFSIVCCLLVGLFAANWASGNKSLENSGSDAWERSVLWESGIRATPDVIWGVGTGDYKQVLNAYYRAHNLPGFAVSNYNSHNQFIQIFFSNGLIGFLSVFLLLARPLYLSVRNQNAFGILTFFPFFIYGMTEVFLGRYQGVVFFALLHQTFVIYYHSRKPSFSLKDP